MGGQGGHNARARRILPEVFPVSCGILWMTPSHIKNLDRVAKHTKGQSKCWIAQERSPGKDER